MINTIISILLLFIIPANIILLALFGIKKLKLDKVIFFVSYGIAPLLNGLFLYYLIWVFPEKNDIFYLGIILALWFGFLAFYFRNWHGVVSFYKKLYLSLKSEFFKKRNLLFLPISFFLLVFSIQALFYPIVDNDKALYLNQSEAVYKYKNLDWQKELSILIRGDDEYKYNSSIRPAIPNFMAFSFMIDRDEDYFVFKFLSSYYHFLLLGLFLTIVYNLAGNLKQNKFKAVLFGSIFFVFSWTLTRSFILNSKEAIIYFFALLGFYLTYKLIAEKKRNKWLEILLGISLGLNVFVNLHGIIIASFVLLILFLYSSLKWKEKFCQVFFVFLIQVFAGAFEFLRMFGFIFASNIKAVKSSLNDLYESLRGYIDSIRLDDTPSNNQEITSKIGDQKNIEPSSNHLDEGHLDLYQMSSLFDIYVKGKFQILTNPGVFGFYFWFFLLIVFNKFKEIFASKLGKIIISFIGIYFLVVLDPFNLNNHPYAVILWGSSKYASLLMLCSMVFVAVYFDWLVKKIVYWTEKFSNGIIFTGLVLFGLVLFFKENLINLGLKTLLSVIPVFKEVGFYQEKIEKIYFLGLFCLFGLVVSLIVLKYKKKYSYILFSPLLLVLFVLTPFFITDASKVPIEKTFTYLFSDREAKLKETIFYGDIYKVYFYAKEKLPRGVVINSVSEIYTYDDHFKIRRNSENLEYIIMQKCGEDFYSLYEGGQFSLCKRR
jgi:hypothetical protein